MAQTKKKVIVFRMMNRNGYAAICEQHVTEGKSEAEALARMEKALLRTAKKVKN